MRRTESRQRIGILWVLAAVLGLWAVGCSDDDGGTEPPPPPAGTPIGADGGTATTADGRALVTIPPGALDAVVDVTITPTSAPPAGALAGTAYDLGPAGTVFAVPVSLALAYDPAILPAGAWQADLTLARVESGFWLPLTGCSVDSATHVVSGATTHFSTFGVVPGENGGEVATLTAILTDTPQEGAEDQFDSLVAALAWLAANLGPEDLGIVDWRTSAPQAVTSLAFAFDLQVDVTAGATAILRGPPAAPLVIDAAGAVTLASFTIEAVGGLVVNANRAFDLSSCELPEVTTVNVGGVAGAPFPAADPGFVSRSKAAARRAKGSAILASNLGRDFRLNLSGSAPVETDVALEGNSGHRVTVGGTAPLAGLSEVSIALTPAPPAPPIPIPYPTIATSLQGQAKASFVELEGFKRARFTGQVLGENEVSFTNCQGDTAEVVGQGAGRLKAVVSHIQLQRLRVDGGPVTGGVEITITEPRLDGTADVTVPDGGDATVTVTGGQISGGSLWITPPGPKGDRPRRHARGGVTIGDLSWNGGELDHVDITGIDGPVAVTGCDFHHGGSPAVSLGLTEIGGAITVGQCQFEGAGMGLVDCTGTATLDGLDLNITSTSSYGVSLGGSAAVTVSGCTITCPGGGVGGIQTGAMNGAVTITGCSLDASQAASALVFGGTNVTCNDNSPISGLVLIADSQVQFAGNTFQGAMVIDDLETPGLLNDPVADNDGLLPGMVMTKMDWDGNGCCDYPPEWNVQDEHGNCAVCDGVPGVRWR